MHTFSDETISRVLINCLDFVNNLEILRHNSFFILVIWW